MKYEISDPTIVRYQIKVNIRIYAIYSDIKDICYFDPRNYQL